MRIGLGQFNSCVGRFDENIASMKRFYQQGLEAGLDLLIFPELAICGYPPEDLLLKRHFLQDNMLAVEKLAAQCPEIPILVGFAESDNGNRYNSLAVLRKGKIEIVYRKVRLPNYGVFDEQRYFEDGHDAVILEIGGVSVALTICEDVWDAEFLAEFLADTGDNDIIVNISASPFHMGKVFERRDMLAAVARRLNAAVAYCNVVGGQDELVFDGQSTFVDADGRVACQAAPFHESLLVAEARKDSSGTMRFKHISGCNGGPIDMLGEIYSALILGTRDYVRKNGFEKVVVGMSGGIDSSVTAAIAVAAIGGENVIGVTMPSRFNTAETRSDAEKQARLLGMEFHSIPIGGILDSFGGELASVEGWTDSGIAYENLQARIRGSILMSLSNKFGWMVLTTGNKSETAVGYSTLYGDTAGGFAVIKDVYKTVVYKLAEYINRQAGREIIPASVIDRPPTAELRDNQKDTDSLPPYEVLDAILKGYVEQDRSAVELIADGFDRELVHRVIRMVDRNEYKRRQSPPGVKITPKAFGRDRRLPITNGYTAHKLRQEE